MKNDLGGLERALLSPITWFRNNPVATVVTTEKVASSMWQHVDVQIVRKVDLAAIGPFENADAMDGIFSSHAYVDMRGCRLRKRKRL